MIDVLTGGSDDRCTVGDLNRGGRVVARLLPAILPCGIWLNRARNEGAIRVTRAEVRAVVHLRVRRTRGDHCAGSSSH